MDIRLATAADLPQIHPVIERAYRGDAARAGWTFESDLLTGARTDLASLSAILDSPQDRLLIAIVDTIPIGCVQVTDKQDGPAYLGLLCIDESLDRVITRLFGGLLKAQDRVQHLLPLFRNEVFRNDLWETGNECGGSL